MSQVYSFTPDIWISISALVILGVMAIYTFRHYWIPGALPFAFASIFVFFWTTGAILENSAQDIPTKLFWLKFQGVWQLPTVTAFTCFLLDYIWPGRWLTRRNLILLFTPSFLFAFFTLIGDPFHLNWQGFSFNEHITPLRGPLNWLILVYAFGLSLIDIISLIYLMRHSSQHFWAVVIILSGHVVARAVYFFEVVNPLRSDMHAIPLGITFSILMYAILLYRFQLFNPIPLAQKTMIDQTPSGMLVLDLHGKIIYMNPSAEQILALDYRRARGIRMAELVSAYQHVIVNDTVGTEIEFPIKTGQDIKQFVMRISSLTDWRGMEVGRLLMLLDQTERRKVQSQLLDHQRSLAIQQERERLARELHDSLGQMLAAIHLQVSAARLVLDQGKEDQTKAGLQTLSEMTVLAETELREYLLGVKTALFTDGNFFTALRHFIQSFRHQYDIQVELCVPPELEARGLNPQVEIQLLRIIQEGLSNVRKHAQTRSAQVNFTCIDSQMKVMISDKGRGFDLQEDELRLGDRFGLRSMRDRAEEIGGYLEISSQPDEGTQVVVYIPRETENETHHKNPEVPR